MKQLSCEMCGSTDMLKQEGFFVCQFCGCKYTVEEAKKMMIEGTVDVTGSTVKVDNSAFVEKYLANARRAYTKGDWEEVEKYYNMVEQNVPDNMEAVFFSAYGKAMLSLSDSDYFKRDQKFKVLDNSISVISDCFETTTEDKEWVLRRIANAVNVMTGINYVFNPSIVVGVGSKSWQVQLLNNVKAAFVRELREIRTKHDDAYIDELIAAFPIAPTKAPMDNARVFSILSIIEAVCGIFTFGFTAFIGIIFGLVALSVTNKGDGKQKNLATIGIILSIVGTILGIVCGSAMWGNL